MGTSDETSFFWYLVAAWSISSLAMTIPIILATVYIFGRSRIAEWCYVAALLIVIATHIVVVVAIGPVGWVAIFFPVWTLPLWHGPWAPIVALVPIASTLFIAFAPRIKRE